MSQYGIYEKKRQGARGVLRSLGTSLRLCRFTACLRLRGDTTFPPDDEPSMAPMRSHESAETVCRSPLGTQLSPSLFRRSYPCFTHLRLARTCLQTRNKDGIPNQNRQNTNYTRREIKSEGKHNFCCLHLHKGNCSCLSLSVESSCIVKATTNMTHPTKLRGHLRSEKRPSHSGDVSKHEPCGITPSAYTGASATCAKPPSDTRGHSNRF